MSNATVISFVVSHVTEMNDVTVESDGAMRCERLVVTAMQRWVS